MRGLLVGLAGLAVLATAACNGANVGREEGWRPPTREECRAAQTPLFGCPGQVSGP